MANDDCLPQLQCCVVRVCVLDGAGVPNPSTDQMYVTDSLTEIKITPVYEDGDEVVVKNACGTVAFSHKGDDSFKRADFAITTIQQDPYLAAMLSGDGTVLTDSGLHGFAFPPIGPLTSNGVSVEGWMKRIDDGDLHAEYPWAWWVMPKIKNLRIGEMTFNSGETLPAYTGQALQNQNWYDGPLNDWPVASTRVAQWFPSATKPESACGPQDIQAS